MSEPLQLVFARTEDCERLLPDACTLGVSCYQPSEVRQLIAVTVQQVFQSLARTGMDLRSLDGITMTEDCDATASSLRILSPGVVSLETAEQPDTFEMARTVPVWRDKELRFHIVMRAGVALGMLASDRAVQSAAYACVAHEAAHVEHEGHLYRTFPALFRQPVPCGVRSRQTFLKAIDVWSEYAACRSSAGFRPEAAEEFENVFCRALEDSLSTCKRCIAAYRGDGNALQAFMDIQQLFGDVFICAGYFLGHLEGLELDLDRPASRVVTLFGKYPRIADLIHRLRRVLHELWLTEYAWSSVEVFSPIYELICAMMALHGFVFAKTETEWRLVMCEEDDAEDAVRKALSSWLRRDD